MPGREFEVESYSVSTVQHQYGTTAFRHIMLTSVDLAHGIRYRASIYFFSTDELRTMAGQLGRVYNVDQSNLQGHTVYAFLLKADFADWYDMLRNEKPLKFSYDYP